MKDKLLIVTDLGLLKAYRIEFPRQGSPRVQLMEEQRFEEAHTKFLERVTDQSGRHSAPTQKKWAAPIGDDHNVELTTKKRLIRQIAGHIQRFLGQDHEDGCWFAANKEILHQILDEIPVPLRNRIEKSIPRDLTKTDPKDLIGYFSSPQVS